MTGFMWFICWKSRRSAKRLLRQSGHVIMRIRGSRFQPFRVISVNDVNEGKELIQSWKWDTHLVSPLQVCFRGAVSGNWNHVMHTHRHREREKRGQCGAFFFFHCIRWFHSPPSVEMKNILHITKMCCCLIPNYNGEGEGGTVGYFLFFLSLKGNTN